MELVVNETSTTTTSTSTTTTTVPPTTELAVSTGYTVEEVEGISAAAAIIGLEVIEFQRTAVYVVSFLTAISPQAPGPLRPRPLVNGSQVITVRWAEEEIPMLLATAQAWDLTPEELQKFGSILLAFFVGLSQN